jgi:hypothetical protein
MQRIGLYNLEPKIVNTAMMQVSQYHKEKGDDVQPYMCFNHDDYDKIYAFSLFNFTPKHYVTKDMICGGTGFDIKSRLPADIEACDLDWTLYPECDYSIQWFSRGCIRNCPFCVVRQKEGYIHPVAPKNLNPNGDHILIMDNNFFASPSWRDAIAQLQEWGQPVNFHQGIDMRIIDKEMCDAINSLKQEGQIHFAWDNPKEDMATKLKEVFDYIRPYRLMCYVLIGYWSTPEQDLYRVETLRSIGVDPFVMPYNKHDRYQKDFARWVNHKAIFKSVPWNEYKVKAIAD